MGRKKKDIKKYEPEKVLETPQETIRDFYRKILLMQEEERRRISQDLHDETGQIVIALGAGLNVIEKEIKAGNLEKVSALIDENRKLIQEIAARMKAMALNLRPPALDFLGLPAVLREYFSQCTRSNNITIEFNENLKDTKIGPDTEITLYRIIQEAISNIVEHSMATVAQVDLMLEDEKIRLIIEDKGRGFDVKEFEQQYDINRIGLRGIKERIMLLKGTFSLESLPNKGTKMEIIFPLKR